MLHVEFQLVILLIYIRTCLIFFSVYHDKKLSLYAAVYIYLNLSNGRVGKLIGIMKEINWIMLFDSISDKFPLLHQSFFQQI